MKIRKGTALFDPEIITLRVSRTAQPSSLGRLAHDLRRSLPMMRMHIREALTN